jgi:hypothetical protein
LKNACRTFLPLIWPGIRSQPTAPAQPRSPPVRSVPIAACFFRWKATSCLHKQGTGFNPSQGPSVPEREPWMRAQRTGPSREIGLRPSSGTDTGEAAGTILKCPRRLHAPIPSGLELTLLWVSLSTASGMAKKRTSRGRKQDRVLLGWH